MIQLIFLRRSKFQIGSLDDPVGANEDATFHLLKNDWALPIIECSGLKKGEGCTDFDASFSHQFRPIAFALGNTEMEPFTRCFTVLPVSFCCG